jgi:hypothetical protein
MVGEIWRKSTLVKEVANMGWSVMAQRTIATMSARVGKAAGRPPGPLVSNLFQTEISSSMGESSTMDIALHTMSSPIRSSPSAATGGRTPTSSPSGRVG